MARVAMLSMHTSPLDPPGVGDGGGMNVYVREISEALARNGVQVDVFTLGNGGRCDVIDLHSGVRVQHVDVETSDLSPSDQLSKATRFAEGVAGRLQRQGNVDVLHAHYWLSGVAGHLLKHQLGIPLVSTFHTLARVKQAAGITSDPVERECTEEKIVGCSDAVTISSGVEAVELQELYGIEDSRLHVIAPGVNHSLFKPGDRQASRARLGLDPHRPTLLYAGRIQPVKGLETAVEALAALRAAHPEVLLVVVGGPSGPDGNVTLDAVQQRIRRESLEANVVLVGPQSRRLMADYYRSADVVVVPSKSESFGLVALEAAACGTPVVASAVGGLRSVVEHGRTGYLVTAGDGIAFARAVDHLLGFPERASALGSQAAERAAAFTWPSAAGQLADLYAGLDRSTAFRNCLTA